MNKENTSTHNNPVETPVRNLGGAPMGNHNARTHGFYSKKCDEARQAAIEEAETIEGLDREIALLRAKIQQLVEYDPDNVKVIFQAVNTLSNVMTRRRFAGKGDWSILTDTLQRIFKGVVIPAAAFRDAIGK